MEGEVMRTVQIDHRRPPFWYGRNAVDAARTGASSTLPATGDESHGTSNLAFRPRAGNISSDTRAGISG
jgi:hypothetical protein